MTLAAPPRGRPVALRWRLLVDVTGRSGAENMAADQALFEQVEDTGAAALRLYRWEPPCLSFGRHEPAARRYDRARIERRGLDAVRRPTGGRAVWHEHELTYAVAAPIAPFGSLRACYREVHRRLAAALRDLGADAALAPDPAEPSEARGCCFSTSAGGEITVGGLKLVGSAQMRAGGAFLQHGSLLLEGSQEPVRAMSRTAPAPSAATTLSAVLGRRVTFAEVAAAIARAWGEELTVQGSAPPPERLVAFFRDPRWTWRR